MCFCNFSKALFSICLILSLLILYFLLNSSSVVGSSDNLLAEIISFSLSFKIERKRGKKKRKNVSEWERDQWERRWVISGSHNLIRVKLESRVTAV